MNMDVIKFLGVAVILVVSAIGCQTPGGESPELAARTSGESDVQSDNQSEEEQIDQYDAFRASLPDCHEGPYFTVPHIDYDSISDLVSLGQVGGPGHNFPTDHQYFYTKAGADIPVYAPGKMYINGLSWTQHSEDYRDFGINFHICKDVSMVFGHISELSPKLEAHLAGATECSSYTAGGTNKTGCSATVNIEIEAGELIGTQLGGYTLDFNAYDLSIDASDLGFINTDHQYSNYFQSVCATNYFEDDIREQYEDLITRNGTPKCGQINYDVAGTAQGLWWVKGTVGEVAEDDHLSLVRHNKDYDKPVIGAGNSFANGPSGIGPFTVSSPESSGLINRPFSEITDDGNIYCYDNLENEFNTVFLVKLVSHSELKIESFNAADCDSLTWEFTASALEFER